MVIVKAGKLSLDNLSDVNAPTPSDNDALTWDAATSKWIPEPAVSTDEKIKISSNDTTSGYLIKKITNSNSITLTENDDGSNETVTIGETHSSSSGADHSYIDQDVTTNASPTFIKATLSQTTGSAPLTISSSTVCGNLNADLWDGYHFADYLDQSVKIASSPSFNVVTVSSITDSTATISGGAISGATYNGITASSGTNAFTLTSGTTDLVVSADCTIDQNLAIAASPTFAGTTLSGLTSGSVLFAGAGGKIGQDNSNFCWDGTNNRLGIGTSTPANKVDILGTGSVILGIKSSTGGVSIVFDRLTGNNAYQFLFKTNGSNNWSFGNAGTGYDFEIYDFSTSKTTFSVKQGHNSGVSLMYLDGSTSKVGILTNSPSVELDVNGDILSRSGKFLGNGGDLIIDPGDSSSNIYIGDKTTTTDYHNLYLKTANSSATAGIFVYPRGVAGNITKYLRLFHDNTTDDSTISSTGDIILSPAHNVGIGTTTPATSAKLDITSTAGALLVPRMTTTQRDALTAVNGMIIYNTTDNQMQGRVNGAWKEL